MTDDAPFLLDVTRLIWRRWRGRLPTGIDRVCLAYLRHFGPKSQAIVHWRGFTRILDRRSSQDLFALLEAPDQGFRNRLVTRGLRSLTHLNGRGRGRPYLNVGHTGLNSRAFRRWTRTANVRPVYLVHDLIPVTHPEFCRPGEPDKHRERMTTVLTTAVGVIANSQVTLDELSAFAREENLPNPPGLAAWLGVEQLRLPQRRKDPERPTFVSVGTIEARKNHLLLLEIWSRLIDRFGPKAPKLLIIGQRGWEAEDVFRILDSDRLRGHVVEISSCSDEELADHLASARALLFPSRAEGFGLPLVEALAMGIPVIASDLPVFREVADGIPTYLDPSDSAGWEAAILDYSDPRSAARREQLDRIRSFSLPDWNSHFNLVERWLARLVGKSQPDQH